MVNELGPPQTSHRTRAADEEHQLLHESLSTSYESSSDTGSATPTDECAPTGPGDIIGSKSPKHAKAAAEAASTRNNNEMESLSTENGKELSTKSMSAGEEKFLYKWKLSLGDDAKVI